MAKVSPFLWFVGNMPEAVNFYVSVFKDARIVEMGPTREIFSNAQHPYTQALLSAVPTPDPNVPPARVTLDPSSFDRGAPLREVVYRRLNGEASFS